MRPHSALFAEVVASSYRLATSASVGGVPMTIVDGTVTLDSTAGVRGRCDVTVVDDGSLGLVPDSPSSLLAPYGNEITLSRGVHYPDGSSELVKLGVFGIQSVEVTDSQEGVQIRVTGLDRAARVIDARFEAPYQIPLGMDYVDAIELTLRNGWGDIPLDLAMSAATTPSLIAQEGDDRWEFCQQMASAISMSLYFNGDGICVLTPAVQSEPVAWISEGERGVLLDAGRNWTREGAYNRVIATGENTGEEEPVRGVATDDDPYSPTYYYGPFGRVPRFYSSPFLTTEDQAASAARGVLRRELGTTEQVNFGSLVLPHLEPDDVVRITRQRAAIDEDHILTSITIPLSATSSMTGQTRASRVNYVRPPDPEGEEPEPPAPGSMLGAWILRSATTPDSMFAGDMRLNSNDPAVVTMVWLTPTDDTGTDVHDALAAISSDQILQVIWPFAESTEPDYVEAQYTITTTPVDNGTYFEFEVSNVLVVGGGFLTDHYGQDHEVRIDPTGGA